MRGESIAVAVSLGILVLDSALKQFECLRGKSPSYLRKRSMRAFHLFSPHFFPAIICSTKS